MRSENGKILSHGCRKIAGTHGRNWGYPTSRCRLGMALISFTIGDIRPQTEKEIVASQAVGSFMDFAEVVDMHLSYD